MTPLQPGGQDRADGDDSPSAETDYDAEDLVVISTREHLVPLQHVTKCKACLKTLYKVFVLSLEQLERHSRADASDPD